MKRRSFSVGAVSILLVFVVLCLVTFGVLSYTTARSDYRFAQTMADNATAYYGACTEAEESLASLSETLRETFRSGPESYWDELPDCAERLGWEWDGSLLTRTVAVSETKELSVVVRPLLPEDGPGYELVSYSTVPVGDWNPDDRLEVLE